MSDCSFMTVTHGELHKILEDYRKMIIDDIKQNISIRMDSRDAWAYESAYVSVEVMYGDEVIARDSVSVPNTGECQC